MSKGSVYTYGHPITNGGKPLEWFPMGRPSADWQYPYKCPINKNGEETIRQCSYDLDGFASCDYLRYHCDDSIYDESYCKYIDFFDPYHTGYGGNYPDDTYMDKVVYPISGERCGSKNYDPINVFKGGFRGKRSMCFNSTMKSSKAEDVVNEDFLIDFGCYNMKCVKHGEDDYQLFVTVGDVTKECTQRGQNISFPETKYDIGVLTCHDPLVACKLEEYLHPDEIELAYPTETQNLIKPETQNLNKPETHNPIQPEEQESGGNGKKKKNTGLVVGVVFAVLIVVAAIAIGLFILYKKIGFNFHKSESADELQI